MPRCLKANNSFTFSLLIEAARWAKIIEWILQKWRCSSSSNHSPSEQNLRFLDLARTLVLSTIRQASSGVKVKFGSTTTKTRPRYWKESTISIQILAEPRFLSLWSFASNWKPQCSLHVRGGYSCSRMARLTTKMRSSNTSAVTTKKWESTRLASEVAVTKSSLCRPLLQVEVPLVSPRTVAQICLARLFLRWKRRLSQALKSANFCFAAPKLNYTKCSATNWYSLIKS